MAGSALSTTRQPALWECRLCLLQVLLLDEVTVDMDVVGRLDLLDFFRQECAQRGAIIVYATHIFDGLEEWVTHVLHIHKGRLVSGRRPHRELSWA